MRVGSTKSEKIERQGRQKWPWVRQKWAKWRQKLAKSEPKGTQSEPKGAKREPKVSPIQHKNNIKDKVAKKMKKRPPVRDFPGPF